MEKLISVLVLLVLAGVVHAGPYKTATVVPTSSFSFGHPLYGVYINTTVQFRSYSPDVQTDSDNEAKTIDSSHTYNGEVGTTNWKATITYPRSSSKAHVTDYQGRTWAVWYSGDVSELTGASDSNVDITPSINTQLLPL